MTDRHRIYLTVATSLVAVVLSALVAPVARAQEPEQFSYRWWKRDLYWKNYYCHGDYHPEGCERWRRWRRWQWNQQPSEGPLCHDSVSATGAQGQTEQAAYDRAVIAWQGHVQFLHGARYTIIAAAKDATVNCAPSNVADAARENWGALYRCEIKARPCRQPPQKLDLRGK